MPDLSIAVLGGGVSGLSAALALARDGHRVTLLDRDELLLGEAHAAVDWAREGVPHFLQAHSLTARGRRELRSYFPDVFQALIDEGANDIDLRPKIRGPTRPDDDDLAILGVRRPLIEWALRRAVLAEPGVDVRSPVRAVGLTATRGSVPTVTGVQTTSGDISADLVVDAMGRRSLVQSWVAALGGQPMAEQTLLGSRAATVARHCVCQESSDAASMSCAAAPILRRMSAASSAEAMILPILSMWTAPGPIGTRTR